MIIFSTNWIPQLLMCSHKQHFSTFFFHSGFNDPDIIREATAAGKEAQQVSEAVKQAPSAVKRQSDFMCPSCTLLWFLN